MAFYKVDKIMQYTETVYIEADNMKDAEELSGMEEGEINHDDTWHDSEAIEITEEAFKEATT